MCSIWWASAGAANGYLLAIISGDLVSVLFLILTGKLWNFVELKGLNKNLWKQMLRFSLPMIPAQISFWIINASDLFFVREMCDGLDGHSGDAWSGLLSTGYFLPTILTTLGLIFYDAWQLSAVTEEDGRARFFTKIFPVCAAYSRLCCSAARRVSSGSAGPHPVAVRWMPIMVQTPLFVSGDGQFELAAAIFRAGSFPMAELSRLCCMEAP